MNHRKKNPDEWTQANIIGTLVTAVAGIVVGVTSVIGTIITCKAARAASSMARTIPSLTSGLQSIVTGTTETTRAILEASGAVEYGWDFTNPIKPSQSNKYQILNQSTQLVFSVSSTLKRALEICKENNFTYFLIKKISYTDERGQSLIFQGIPKTEGGVLISESIAEEFDAPVGNLQAQFEVFFFNEVPIDPLAVVVGKVLGFLP